MIAPQLGANRAIDEPGVDISGLRYPVIDIHCHFGVPNAEDLVGGPVMLPFVSEDTARVNRAMFAAVAPKLNSVAARLADMDRSGIDIQVLSPQPGQYHYDVDPELGREVARSVNDGIAAAIDSCPDRFAGMGTLPMQEPRLAVAEMIRCVRDLGLRGIEIGTNVNGVELADNRFEPIFAQAEALGIVLFLHPLGFTHADRLTAFHLNNIIGNPLESTIAISHLIFSGVLDRHSALKLCVAHGGGYLPAYWGRMDHAFHAREDCRVHIARPPSSYLRQIWLDTVVFDRYQLDNLVRTHGADRLCLGTDYPFDMAEPDAADLHRHLASPGRERIMGRNAAELFGLPCACPAPVAGYP